MTQNVKHLPQPQTLADFLKTEKGLPQCTQSKISITNKALSSIGKAILPKYLGITHLLLSNNHLASLSGIEVFPNLTHLSIASNDIESIDELRKVLNKSLIVSLSVKKNFILKNPQTNIDIINLFPNLKYLDGFKISKATLKVISESESLSFQIMSFAILLQHKVSELQKLYSLIKLNDEFTRKKAKGINSIEDIEAMINQIKTLLKLNRVSILSQDYIRKYLNKNINPSVHVLKKIMFNSGLTEKEEQDLKLVSHKEYSQCYLALFCEIISMYESKNNHHELPFFLNYLILKDNPLLAKFFFQEISQQSADNTDKTYLEAMASMCKELPSLFLHFTNYSIEQLTKYQLMYFYQINKEDSLCGYHPTPEDVKIYFEQGNEKISLDGFNSKVSLCLKNLECDSFPVFALNFDYMRCLTSVMQNRIIEYKNKTDKLLYFIQLLNERKKMFLPKGEADELFKYHFAVNNMRTAKKEDLSQVVRGNKFNKASKSNDCIQIRRNSRSRSKSTSAEKHKRSGHSTGHIAVNQNQIAIIENREGDNAVVKERSKSNEEEYPHQHKVKKEKTTNIPFIVKPNEQFTLAENNEDHLIKEDSPKALKNPRTTLKASPKNYLPTQKSDSDIIKQIKKDKRANSLVKRYMKYNKGFVALDIITRLALMKKFISRLSLKVLKLKLPYLISAIDSYKINHISRKFLYGLWCINQRSNLIRHHLFSSLKQRLFKLLKQHRAVSIHLRKGYYSSLLSKAFYALKENKRRQYNKKQRYNKMAYYYYSKLKKKVWLIIKFYFHTQKSKEDDYPKGKYNSQFYENSSCDYDKVFSFFHNDERALNDIGFDGSKDFRKASIKSNYEIIEEDNEEERSQDSLYANSSLNQVDSLIGHLQNRILSMTKTKKAKAKIENEKNVFDGVSSSKIANQSIKGRNKPSKKNNIESNDLCPYCVSAIEHDKCVGISSKSDYIKYNTVNPSNAKILLLGAPNYIRNTSTFIHKKLK